MAKKRQIPHTYVIIFSIIVIAAILTWIVPGGEFQRETKIVNGVERTVIVENSFHKVEKTPQTWQVFSALFKGFVDKSDNPDSGHDADRSLSSIPPRCRVLPDTDYTAVCQFAGKHMPPGVLRYIHPPDWRIYTPKTAYPARRSYPRESQNATNLIPGAPCY